MHPSDNFKYPHCRDQVDAYERLVKIGQGTFGEVFKARDRETKDLVALKKVLMENEKEGFPITALRELRILQLLKHKNVVRLIEICRSKGAGAIGSASRNSTFYLVFEFCEHDLAGLLNNSSIKFKLAEIKNLLQQLLYGLYYIHNSKILHRDMKAANILITKNGVLKLADFGLARAFSTNDKAKNRFTNRVVTLWYRPPELLLGDRYYGTAIDMWGAGCIMAEMWTRSPIMQGSSEQKQLEMICQLCGSITKENWPDHERLELAKKIELPQNKTRRVKDRLQNYIQDPHALDLLDRLLTLDPSRRIDTESALDHDFFFCDPLPVDCANVLKQCDRHMFEFLTKNNSHQHHQQHHQQQHQQHQHQQHQKNALKSSSNTSTATSASLHNQQRGYHRGGNNGAGGAAGGAGNTTVPGGPNNNLHQGRRTAHQAGMHNSSHPPQRKPHRNPDQHYEQIF